MRYYRYHVYNYTALDTKSHDPLSGVVTRVPKGRGLQVYG